MRCFVRDIYGAATRLNIVGCYESCKMQASCHGIIEELLSKIDSPTALSKIRGPLEGQVTSKDEFDAIWSVEFDAEETQAATPAPVLNIVQSRHDLIYSKLFNT
jgi:hypothetical protein